MTPEQETPVAADKAGLDIAALAAHQVPALAHLKQACTRLLASSQLALADVATRIADDPGLILAVLRRVNQGRGEHRARITSIDSAVNLLGQAQLETLIETVPVLEETCAGDDLPRALRLYERQRLAAHFAVHWAQLREDKSPSECRVAAICSGFAEILLCVYHSEQYRRAAALAGVCSEAAATQTFGVGYAQVGRELAATWALPELIGDALTPSRHQFYRPLGLMLANELARVLRRTSVETVEVWVIARAGR